MQYQLPLALDAVSKGKLSLQRVVAMSSSNPAQKFGLRNKGKISPGLDADIILVNLEKKWTIRNSGVLSRCGWTPYDGRECKGFVERTLLRGQDVYSEGKVVGMPGGGRLVHPHS